MESNVVLETEHLTKRYGRRVAVERLSLRVERGDLYGFLGQNGAGKSTTIRMLLGLIKPTSGTFQLLGCAAGRKSLRARARIGAIIDAPAFYEQMSGRRNLSLLASLSGGASRARIAEVLELVGLCERADDPVRAYSQGMRQRLGIAQALLPAPELIILDEPTNGLDPQGMQDVRALLRRLRDEQGLTVLLSSHLLAEVERLCDRVGIIHEGRLLYQGGVSQLLAHSSTYRLCVDRPDEACRLLADEPALVVRRNGADCLYLEAPIDAVPALNARLVAQGIRVFELAPCRQTLEDVFLKLTQSGS